MAPEDKAAYIPGAAACKWCHGTGVVGPEWDSYVCPCIAGKEAEAEYARRHSPKRDRCNACGVEWPDENHRCAMASPMEQGIRRW